jgi:hypothetical protein
MKPRSVARTRGQFMVQCLTAFACSRLPAPAAETREHIKEAAETLGEALKVRLIRTGV